MAIVLNGSTGIQNVLGSASSPAESNTSSSNTGLYFPSSTTLGLSTAGTNALYIDASQNVGIGTTLPSNKLSVNGTAVLLSGNTLQLNNSSNTGLAKINCTGGGTLSLYSYNSEMLTLYEDSAIIFKVGSGTERMRIDSSGNLLVGTTVSKGKLTLNGYNTITAYGDLIAQFASAGTSTTSWINLQASNSGYGASLGISGDNLLFGTNLSNGTGVSERMRIDSSGNVGIGTSSPINKLDVENNANSTTFIVSGNANSGASARAGIYTLSNTGSGQFGTVSSTWNLDGNINANETYAYGSSGLLIFAGGSAPIRFNTGSTERARIDSSGSLLVGTTATTGNASNSNYIAGGVFTTANGTLSVANSTATTFVTLPSLGNGVFIVSIGIPGAAGASNYLSTALVSTQTSTSVVSALHSGTNVSITTSGLNVQVTQTGGTTYTMSWSIIRVA